VVAGEQLALHLEQVLRVAQVGAQLVADLALRLHEVAAERLVPRAQHRVGLAELVQRDGAVVGVDRRLDRVAHVVDLLAQRATPPLWLSVVASPKFVRCEYGEAAARRVAVDDPDDPAVDRRRVGVGVQLEERRDLRTRSRGSRMYMSRLWSVMASDSSRLGSR
jgi:hypothetical protein